MKYLFLPLSLILSLGLLSRAVARDVNVAPTRIERPPMVDGRLDDEAWKHAPRLGSFTVLGTGEKAAPGTTFMLLYDDEYLYFGAEMDEPDVASLHAVRSEPDDVRLHEDDCVELFLAAGKQRTNYYQFLINPKGVLTDQERVQGGVVYDVRWNSGARSAATVGDKKWTVEMAIPWASLDMKDAFTGDWGLNVARERRAGGGLELSSFVPMTGSFQQPALFAPMSLDVSALKRYAWEIGRPDEISVYKADGKLRMKARIYVKNLTGKLRAIGVRAGLGNEASAQGTSEIGDNLDADQSKIYHLDLEVPEPGTTFLTVDVVPRGKPSELYCSRIHTVDLSYEPIAIALDSPAYRDTIFASEDFSALKGSVTSSLPVGDLAGARLILQVVSEDRPDERIAEKTLDVLAPVTEFSIPLPQLPEGKFVLQVVLQNHEAGEIGRSSRAFRRLPPPSVGHEWRIAAGGVLKKDGRPVFPVGWFSIPPQDVQAANGLYNAILSYVGPDMSVLEIRKYLDGIAAAGASAMISPYPSTAIMERGSEPLSEADAASIRKRVEQFRGHPALLGWYIGDEPEYHQVLPSRLRQVTNLIAEVDPYHPTMLINNSNAGLEAFAKSADILNPDPYPFFKRGGNSLTPLGKVANMVRTACRVSTPENSAWATLQTYNTEDFGGKGERFPTFVEMRNMTWQSLAAGARGLLFWAYEWALNYPDLMIGVPFLAGEIKHLEPWILVPEVGGVDAGDENLIVSRRVSGDAQLVIAASVLDREHEFALRIPELANTMLDVLGENRQVAVDAEGVLRDGFEPFGTHLYSVGIKTEGFSSLSQVQSEIDAANAGRRRSGNLAFEESGVDVTASSTGLYRPGAKRVVDGVRDGMAWESTSTADENWLLFTWKEPQKLGRILMFSDAVEAYEVQVPEERKENGAIVWKTVARAEGSGTSPIEVSFPPVRTGQLRFVITKRKPGALADRVWEIEIYEK